MDGVKNNMFYVVITLVGPMRELYGWTDNEYIIKEFIRNSEPEHGVYYIMEYDCTMIDFIEQINIDFDLGERLSYFKLRLLTTKTGRTLIITKDLYETILGDTSIMYQMISELIVSLRNLSMLSEYMIDKSHKIMIQFMIKTLLPLLVLAYNTGDIHNCGADWLYLLLLEGYATEVK